jgi:hypothetical protein
MCDVRGHKKDVTTRGRSEYGRGTVRDTSVKVN